VNGANFPGVSVNRFGPNRFCQYIPGTVWWSSHYVNNGTHHRRHAPSPRPMSGGVARRVPGAAVPRTGAPRLPTSNALAAPRPRPRRREEENERCVPGGTATAACIENSRYWIGGEPQTTVIGSASDCSLAGRRSGEGPPARLLLPGGLKGGRGKHRGLDSRSGGGNSVEVQVLSSAPNIQLRSPREPRRGLTSDMRYRGDIPNDGNRSLVGQSGAESIRSSQSGKFQKLL